MVLKALCGAVAFSVDTAGDKLAEIPTNTRSRRQSVHTSIYLSIANVPAPCKRKRKRGKESEVKRMKLLAARSSEEKRKKKERKEEEEERGRGKKQGEERGRQAGSDCFVAERNFS